MQPALIHIENRNIKKIQRDILFEKVIDLTDRIFNVRTGDHFKCEFFNALAGGRNHIASPSGMGKVDGEELPVKYNGSFNIHKDIYYIWRSTPCKNM